MKFIYWFLSLIFIAISGFLVLYFFDKNHKIIQKTVEVEINFKNIINVCKSLDDDDFSISF
jgi:hypothetical protein